MGDFGNACVAQITVCVCVSGGGGKYDKHYVYGNPDRKGFAHVPLQSYNNMGSLSRAIMSKALK